MNARLFLRRFARWGSFAAVAMLVLTAVYVTALRVVLPHAENYRIEAQVMVAAWLGQPVLIERVEARLDGLTPTLELHQVRLLDAIGGVVIADFDRLQVGIAPVASLIKGEPVLRQVTIVGARLTVTRQADGRVELEGLTYSGADESNDPEAAGRWILAQEHLALRQCTVIWRDALRHGQREQVFDGVSLELRNQGDRHRLVAALRLPESLGESARLNLDLRGDLFAAEGARGQLYFEGERLRPVALAKALALPDGGLDAGEVTLRAWGEWSGQALLGLRGEVRAEGLSWPSPRDPLRIDDLQSHFAWEAGEAGSYRFDLADLTLLHHGRRWEPTRLRLDYRLDQDGGLEAAALQSTFARVDDLAAFATLLPLDAQQTRLLRGTAPRGTLHELRAEYERDEGWRAGADFNDLSVMPHGELPGIDGLDGRLAYGNGMAVLELASTDTTLHIPSLFRAGLVVRGLSGSLQLERDGSDWRLQGRDLVAANDDVAMRLDLDVIVPEAGAPQLDLRGRFQDARASAVPRYLPVHIMGPGAVTWLERAFRDGRVEEGTLLFHGDVADFPFDKGEGRFEVRFRARGVDLDYLPDWPRLEGIDGEVVFDGRRMHIEAKSARLLNSAVRATRVEIADLTEPRLRVRGTVEGPFVDLLDYLRVTGLAGQFGETVAGLKPSGRSRLDLDFEEPLGSDMTPGQASGKVTFLNAGLAVAEGVAFERLQGTLMFEGERYQSDRIEARLLGEPVTISVTPLTAITRLDLAGEIDAATAAPWLTAPVVSRLHGRSGWTAQLELPHADQAGVRLNVYSELRGIRSQLPHPFDKEAEAVLPLHVTHWLGGARAGQTDVVLAGRGAGGVEQDATGKITRAAIHFGDGAASLPPARGILVSGRLYNVRPSAWRTLMPAPVVVDPSDGADMAGPMPVWVKMDVLEIAAEEAGPVAEAAPVQPTYPPLKIDIGRLDYGGARLGRLSLDLQPQGRQLSIRQFRLQGDQFELSGSGSTRTVGSLRTQVDLKLVAQDMGRMASDLGLASVITKGKLEAQTRMGWPGMPTDFDLAQIDGTLHVKLRDGVIEELQPGAGRLLGLLSLQALPQRLILDFRDMYEKGMRFRHIGGNFRIENGNASTSDLRMDTLPATVFVTGRTGFVRHDFEHTVTVVPEVANTLPVAGGLALGPQVGAVLWLFQGLFKSQIDSAAQYRYTIAGPWDAPVVQRLR